MVGYTEALTDPSYNGQILTLTYPLVGNYGVPDPSIKDNDGIPKFFESDKMQIRGLVVHELSLTASHWNLSMTLDEWMYNEKVPGISGIDTRELTKKLRTGGVMMAALVVSDSEIDVEQVKKELESSTHYDSEQFMDVDASSMMSKWLGEAEKNVSKLFAMARQYAEKEGKPVILFVDEVDSLLGSRSSEVGGEVRTKNQFLTEMDGVNQKGKDLMLYVIGATNKPWSLDWPFLRRFQKRIYVSLPSQEAREHLFEEYTAPLRKSIRVNPVDLAKFFDGYSASDIKDICQAAQIKTVHEIFNSPDYHEPVAGEAPVQPRELTTADFKDIMARRKPSVSTEMIRAYHKWSEEFKAL